jgi:hypothetical protein
MILYRNKYNLRYYRVRKGRVYYSRDRVVWCPSVFTVGNVLNSPDIFKIVTLENK